jgi:hypothetical protein
MCRNECGKVQNKSYEAMADPTGLYRTEHGIFVTRTVGHRSGDN